MGVYHGIFSIKRAIHDIALIAIGLKLWSSWPLVPIRDSGETPGIRTAEASNWRCSSGASFTRTFILGDFTDFKQPKYRVCMGVEWEFYGISMGDWREVYGRFNVLNGTFHPLQWSYETNHLSMGRTWGYDGISWVAWVIQYFQQHLRISIFSGVFHCPRCSRYGPKKIGPKFHVSKATLSSFFNFFTPGWKIWKISGFFSQPSILSILRVLTLDHPKSCQQGIGPFSKIEGLEGLEDPDFAGHRGGFHVYFQEGKLLTWKTTNSSPVCSEKPFWKWLVFTNIKLGYII